MGVAYVNERMLRRLKEELSWAIDKPLWLIINTMLVICTTKNLKNKAIFNLKQYCMHCYVILSILINAYKDAITLSTATKPRQL